MSAERRSESIGNILPDVIRALGVEKRMEEITLREKWGDMVGEVMAGRCRPLDIKGEILFVAVVNNVWMQEINFYRDKIVGRIKKRFPRLKVRGIRLVIEREKIQE